MGWPLAATIIEQELAMHEVSFAQPEVRERIETLFGGYELEIG